MAETIDRNLYLTGNSFSVAKKRIFAPLQALIDSDYNLLPLDLITRKFPEIKIIDYTYQAIKNATRPLLNNLRNWEVPRNRDDRLTFLKETITQCPTLPVVPNIIFQLRMSQKGCKATRRTIASDPPSKDLWKCIKKLKQK